MLCSCNFATSPESEIFAFFNASDTNVSNSLDAEYHLDLDEVRTALNTDLDSMIQIINSFDTFLRRFMKSFYFADFGEVAPKKGSPT